MPGTEPSAWASAEYWEYLTIIFRYCPQGSEAGGEDALVGNVSKLTVTPPGYTGAPRKGHLIFDACFESGNLGRVDYISEFEFDLFIRPDTCNPRFRVWFNFTVEHVRETQRVIFNIVNFSKTKSLYRDGMAPVVKSTSRPKWQRLPAKNVYYYRCPDHRRNYVMSFAFCFDREDDVYQFAYCYPYTYSRLQHYLTSLEQRNLEYLKREQLGLSVQQRRLDLLTITNPDNIEEFENSIMQKKMKIPKMSTRNAGHAVDNHFGEERMSLRHKKVQSQEQQRTSSNSSKSLAAVVARLERNAVSSCVEGEELERLGEEEEGEEGEEAVVPRVLYEELVHSYRQQEEEVRRLQQELERTRRQLLQQAKKLKEYSSLLTEVKELRDFNRRLQDVLLMRLGSEPMHDNGTQTIKAEVVEPIAEPQEVCREEANTSSTHSPSPRTVYTFNDGKVHLGGGIWVEEEKWHQLQRTQGDSKFTKNLAVMIWGTETLKNRSVTGVATKKKKDALPKPPLSPSKLKIVRECLYDRVSQETADSAEITQRLSKVNKYICEKIMDINKSIKNEERRESKLLIRQTVKMENFSYDGV
ncbi:BEN domain-containing protein 5-like isoform X2 [Hoplias malabaricus]|uniref:BEN domain-containing protein 5-like isoform X2 n=2 Tax=Hoplias malabaricus TaxID=27720 RepID=UPI00346343D6